MTSDLKILVVGIMGATLLASCDQPPPGEPVVRTEIRPTEAGTDAAMPDPSISAQVESACRPIIFENEPFTHCLAIPSRHDIATVFSGPSGTPYRGFSAYLRDRQANAPSISFAMNGGRFDEEGTPLGYLVQGAERVSELERGDSPDGDQENEFYLKPNGVFFGTDGDWQVRSTAWFLENVSERPQFGTQSGPMLVIDGALHPALAVEGGTETVRSAVGVDAAGRAHFVISSAPVSLRKLARLYRDEFETRNALALDGETSGLWNPARDRMDDNGPLGPLIVVTKVEDGE